MANQIYCCVEREIIAYVRLYSLLWDELAFIINQPFKEHSRKNKYANYDQCHY